jgi:hypothetical protein
MCNPKGRPVPQQWGYSWADDEHLESVSDGDQVWYGVWDKTKEWYHTLSSMILDKRPIVSSWSGKKDLPLRAF